MKLPVQTIDQRLFTSLGITTGKAGFAPLLSDQIVAVVQLPLSEERADGALGFNDAETEGLAAFAAYITQANVAAQNSYAQIFNPAGSGKIVYVDRALRAVET